jgi:hypothetical protein
MLAAKIVCPHCHRSLKTTKPLAVGKRVLCKQCGTTFRVSPPDVSENTPRPVRQGMATVPALGPLFQSPALPNDEPIATELDNSQMIKIAVVGLVLACGFLLIGGGSVLALVYAARIKDRQQAVSTKKDATSSEERTTAASNLRSPRLPLPPDDAGDDPKRQGDGDPITVQTPRLSPEEQQKVDQALERGLAFLKQHQRPSGSWPGQHPTGMAALPALTLLECGVPPDDPQVKKAAEAVRKAAPNLVATYELSLAILFLDRLGDPKDKPLIRTFALRLVVGQQADGGWTYHCPLLSSRDEKELLDILEKTRPRNPLDLFTGPDGKIQQEFIVAPKGVGGDPAGPLKGSTQAATAEDLATAIKDASPAIKRIPSLQPPDTASKFTRNVGSDNSNTQFAILAVWVAGRHNVPLERTVALIVKRFRTSQHKDGTWGYHSSPNPQPNDSPAMTAAGLLGLGVGHGMMAQALGKEPNQAGVQDAVIGKGFQALSRNVDLPLGSKPGRNKNRAGINLYLLWSIERVGVMYNLTKFMDRDWYQWGAEQLVESQNADGSWNGGTTYPGETPFLDTALALLFLKRANLTNDLAKKLENIIDVKDLGSR